MHFSLKRAQVTTKASISSSVIFLMFTFSFILL